jgi:hypothetical protein
MIQPLEFIDKLYNHTILDPAPQRVRYVKGYSNSRLAQKKQMVDVRNEFLPDSIYKQSKNQKNRKQ